MFYLQPFPLISPFFSIPEQNCNSAEEQCCKIRPNPPPTQCPDDSYVCVSPSLCNNGLLNFDAQNAISAQQPVSFLLLYFSFFLSLSFSRGPRLSLVVFVVKRLALESCYCFLLARTCSVLPSFFGG